MQHHRRADQVKMCNIVQDRPGIIHPFMQPTKLKNQVRIGQKRTNLKFLPQGKNLVGGTQWVIEPQRPGLARPLIIAKREQKALAKGLALEARIAGPRVAAKAKAMAIKATAQAAKVEAASAEIEKSAGVDGYGNYYGAYGSYGY